MCTYAHTRKYMHIPIHGKMLREKAKEIEEKDREK